jgi:hypothetical protein
MLREYQEQIKALRDQLEATQRGVIIGEDGREVPVHNARKEIVEKIVEREVVREVKVGISEKEMEEIRKKANEEKQFLMKQAQEDMKALIDQQSRTAQERHELQKALDREAEDRRKIEEQKSSLQQKLKVLLSCRSSVNWSHHFLNRNIVSISPPIVNIRLWKKN